AHRANEIASGSEHSRCSFPRRGGAQCAGTAPVPPVNEASGTMIVLARRLLVSGRRLTWRCTGRAPWQPRLRRGTIECPPVSLSVRQTHAHSAEKGSMAPTTAALYDLPPGLFGVYLHATNLHDSAATLMTRLAHRRL